MRGVGHGSVLEHLPKSTSSNAIVLYVQGLSVSEALKKTNHMPISLPLSVNILLITKYKFLPVLNYLDSPFVFFHQHVITVVWVLRIYIYKKKGYNSQ